MSKKQETPEEKLKRETTETIANTIENLSQTVNKLLAGRLKKESVVILLAHSTKLPQRDVLIVLEAMSNMAKDNLK